MADDPTIHANTGKTPLFNFSAATAISNLLRETESTEQTGERDELIGEDDTTQAVIFSDLGVRVNVTGTMLTGFTQPAKGAAFTAGGVDGFVTDSRVSRTTRIAKVTLAVELPDAITAVS